MSAGRAYWIGVATLFVTLLLVGFLPMAIGLPLLIVALWAMGQVVRGRWPESHAHRLVHGEAGESW